MRRREFLATSGAAALASCAFPCGWTAAAEKKVQKVLYFTRSVGFEHSTVRQGADGLSHSDKTLIQLGKKAGFEVVCSKDGRVFDQDLAPYDLIAFFSCGDLCNPDSKPKTPPMSPGGKQKLLDAIAAGKGFVGFHSTSDSFHTKGERNKVQPVADRDPFLAMLGGEFIIHGAQQVAAMQVASPHFPGCEEAGKSFAIKEEWYALKNFAPDMHVVLVQETEGMKGNCYQRPPYPATWARMHGKGRVFFTSLGHREDVWDNPLCQKIILGGFAWAMRNVDAKIPANLKTAAPHCDQLSATL